MNEVHAANFQTPKRLIIKIGSRALLGPPECFDTIASEVAKLRRLGIEVIVVSSGAIAFGRRLLAKSFSQKNTLPRLQAAAAIGQSALLAAYQSAFDTYGLCVAQLLLTRDDLANRERFLNARAAMDAVVEAGAVPVINENDTVAVEEIRFGDNDQLAAMAVTAFGADTLLLLTNVEGVLDEHGALIDIAPPHIEDYVRAETSDVGTGGMSSKVSAALMSQRHGVQVLIGGAETLLDGFAESVKLGHKPRGTLFIAPKQRLPSRKAWLAFSTRTQGTVLVDDGAARALQNGASLLTVGVLGVRGDFRKGDAVEISKDGQVIARGLARLSMSALSEQAGQAGIIAIHHDDLVIT